VDNGSSDGSAKYFIIHFPEIILDENDTNCGFAGDMNAGMTMWLAFSIAIHADPKCFLVDEALTVGDAYFQQKCMRKIQEFWAGDGSIVFVSHDMNAVKMLCKGDLAGPWIDYRFR